MLTTKSQKNRPAAEQYFDEHWTQNDYYSQGDVRPKVRVPRIDGWELGRQWNNKPMNQSPVTTRRTFDEAFQREAVQNWLASGKSADVIARELGLNTNLLYAWKKRWLPAAAGGRAAAGGKPGSVADLQAQLDVALRENRQLREQRDILKKTLGILSAPSPNAMNGSPR